MGKTRGRQGKRRGPYTDRNPSPQETISWTTDEEAEIRRIVHDSTVKSSHARRRRAELVVLLDRQIVRYESRALRGLLTVDEEKLYLSVIATKGRHMAALGLDARHDDDDQALEDADIR